MSTREAEVVVELRITSLQGEQKRGEIERGKRMNERVQRVKMGKRKNVTG